MKNFLKFAIVGGVGFVVDTGVLMILLRSGLMGPFLGRILSIFAAMTTTWLLNRTFTFKTDNSSVVTEGLRYGSVGLVTAFFNYLLYSTLLLTIPVLKPIAAVFLATSASMFMSFLGYSRYVFRPKVTPLPNLESPPPDKSHQ